MKKQTYILNLILLALSLNACFSADVLSPEPTALDLDTQAPSCPGIASVTPAAGPSLSIQWDEGSDNLSDSSKITY